MKGRKRYLLVDAQGLVLKAKVHAANAQSGEEGDRVRELPTTIEEFQRGVLPVAHGHYLAIRLPTPHRQR